MEFEFLVLSIVAVTISIITYFCVRRVYLKKYQKEYEQLTKVEKDELHECCYVIAFFVSSVSAFLGYILSIFL